MLSLDTLQGVDLDNPDVKRAFQVFSEQIETLNSKHEEEIQRLKMQAAKREEKLKGQAAKREEKLKGQLKELMKIIRQLKKTGGRRSRNSRSYNVRKYKGYPRTETNSQKSIASASEQEEFETIHEAAGDDLKCCPVCGEKLAESSSYRDRTSCEDIRDGKWCNVHVRIYGRYCHRCDKIMEGKPVHFLKSAHLGMSCWRQSVLCGTLSLHTRRSAGYFGCFMARDCPPPRWKTPMSRCPGC